jgi:hypothetical protein
MFLYLIINIIFIIKNNKPRVNPIITISAKNINETDSLRMTKSWLIKETIDRITKEKTINTILRKYIILSLLSGILIKYIL